MADGFALGPYVKTLEIVSPALRGSALVAFKPRASHCRPFLLRYMVVEVTSFPEASIRILPFEHFLHAFWRRSSAEAWIQRQREKEMDNS